MAGELADDADVGADVHEVGAPSFATTLVRGGTDLVIAAELLGHARLRDNARLHTPHRRGPPTARESLYSP